MRAFITGIAGFAGSHLCEYLLTNTQLNVSGLIHSRTENISHLKDQVKLYEGDLFDLNSIGDILSAANPDYIFHLAGEANVPFSFSSPWQTFQSNVLSQINLLEKVRQLVPDARVLIVGSAEEYGQVRPEDIPIGETVPFRPDTPYGVSKIAQDMVGASIPSAAQPLDHSCQSVQSHRCAADRALRGVRFRQADRPHRSTPGTPGVASRQSDVAQGLHRREGYGACLRPLDRTRATGRSLQCGFGRPRTALTNCSRSC